MKPQLQRQHLRYLIAGPASQIQKLTGVDRKTIRRYRALLAAAQAKSPGEVTTGSQSGESQIPPPRPPALEAPVTSLTSGVVRSACEPHRTWIEQQVRLKRNAQAIYQDLVDQYGFAASYESVKRFVRTLRDTDPHQFDRLEFFPGEEAQADYGEGALTVDPNSGQFCRMVPVVSAIGIKTDGSSKPRVGWFQRISASNPTPPPLRRRFPLAGGTCRMG